MVERFLLHYRRNIREQVDEPAGFLEGLASLLETVPDPSGTLSGHCVAVSFGHCLSTARFTGVLVCHA